MMRSVGVLVVAVVLGTWAGEARAEKDKFEVGEPVQVFALRAVNSDVIGENLVAVDKYFGAEAKDPKKAILVSFFATYCEPCKREMPYLAALYDTYKDKGLMVMSVSIDRDAEQIEFVKNLAAQSNVKFPVLSDRFNIVAKRYFISKLPLVYLINGEGKVALARVGYNDDISRTLLDEVRKLVGEPTTSPVPDALARFMGGHGAAPATAEAAPPTPTATDATPASVQGSDEAPAAEPVKKGKGKKGKAKKAKGKKK